MKNKEIQILNNITQLNKNEFFQDFIIKVKKIQPIDCAAAIAYPVDNHVLIVENVNTISQFKSCVFNLFNQTPDHTIEVYMICNILNLKEKIYNNASLFRRISFYNL